MEVPKPNYETEDNLIDLGGFLVDGFVCLGVLRDCRFLVDKGMQHERILDQVVHCTNDVRRVLYLLLYTILL